MDKNIKYVREQRVAPLLNDMVMHLLATTPGDPLQALVSYLERRQHQERASANTQATPTPAPPAEGRPHEAGRKAAKPGKGTPSTAAKVDEVQQKAPEIQPASPAMSESDIGSLLAKMIASEEAFAAKVGVTGHASTALAADLLPLERIQTHIGRLLQEIRNNEKAFMDKLATSDGINQITYGAAVQSCAEVIALTRDSENILFSTKITAEAHEAKEEKSSYLLRKGFAILGEIRRAEAAVGEKMASAYAAGVAANIEQDAFNTAMRQHLELTQMFEQAEMNQIRIESFAKTGKALGYGGLTVLQEVTKDIVVCVDKIKMNVMAMGGQEATLTQRLEKLDSQGQVGLLLSEIAAEEANFLEKLTYAVHTASENVEAVHAAMKASQEMSSLANKVQTNIASMEGSGMPDDLAGIANELEKTTRAINARMFQLNRATAAAAAAPTMASLSEIKKGQVAMEAKLKAWNPDPKNKDEMSLKKQALGLMAAEAEVLQDSAKLTANLKMGARQK